jgi:putative ABC transport system ATP-binding protein
MLSFDRASRGRLAVASLGFSLHQACEALVPIVVGITIDVAIARSDLPRLLIALGVLGVVFVVLLYVWRMGELASTRAFIDTTYEARRGRIGRLLTPRSAPGGTPAQTLSILASDVNEAAGVIWTVPRAIASAAAVVTASVALLLISPPLAALVLIGTPVLMVVLHVTTRPLERRSAAEQSALAESSALAGDLLAGLRSIKGLSAEGEAVRRFQAVNARSLRAALRAATAEGAFAGLSSLISGAYLIALAGIATAAVVRGDLTPGQLVTVIGLAQFLQWPITSLGLVGAQLARARASAKRVGALGGQPAGAGQHVEVERGAVVIERMALPSGRVLSLRVGGGELVGVVLDERDATELSRRFAVGAPELSVDGTALAAPPAAGRVPAVIAPPHEPMLVTGTLRENVFPPGDEHVSTDLDADSDADLADAASLHDILAIDGWERGVGERGRLLSGGQRQRVALARALAHRPAVLVLREPITSVDAVTQADLARGIRRYRAGLTTILLTSNPVLLAACDRVVELGERVVVERGA